jgi:hypothetical protein
MSARYDIGGADLLPADKSLEVIGRDTALNREVGPGTSANAMLLMALFFRRGRGKPTSAVRDRSLRLAAPTLLSGRLQLLI